MTQNNWGWMGWFMVDGSWLVQNGADLLHLHACATLRRFKKLGEQINNSMISMVWDFCTKGAL